MRLGVSAALVDGVLVSGDVSIADGVIEAVGLPGATGSDIAAPGSSTCRSTASRASI